MVVGAIGIHGVHGHQSWTGKPAEGEEGDVGRSAEQPHGGSGGLVAVGLVAEYVVESFYDP